MGRLHRLLLPTLLLTVIVSGLSLPVSAPNGDIPHLTSEPQFINVPVSSTFDVEIWIRNLKLGPMVGLQIYVKWDTAMMEYVSHTFHTHGWSFTYQAVAPESGEIILSAEPEEGNPPISGDEKWITITFHCLAEGTSTIQLASADTIWILDNGEPSGYVPDIFETTVNQVEPAPVGGVLMTVNKLEILTPYIALAGLIAAVSTVYVIKRRKD